MQKVLNQKYVVTWSSITTDAIKPLVKRYITDMVSLLDLRKITMFVVRVCFLNVVSETREMALRKL